MAARAARDLIKMTEFCFNKQLVFCFSELNTDYFLLGKWQKLQNCEVFVSLSCKLMWVLHGKYLGFGDGFFFWTKCSLPNCTSKFYGKMRDGMKHVKVNYFPRNYPYLFPKSQTLATAQNLEPWPSIFWVGSKSHLLQLTWLNISVKIIQCLLESKYS